MDKVYIVTGEPYHENGHILGIYATIDEALTTRDAAQSYWEWEAVLVWEWAIGSELPQRVSSNNFFRFCDDIPRIEEWAGTCEST